MQSRLVDIHERLQAKDILFHNLSEMLKKMTELEYAVMTKIRKCDK